jgi:hypothetical protein
MPILVKFGGPWTGKCCYILCPLGIFYGRWYNLWPFGIVCGLLVYLLRFGMFGPRKIWQPWLERKIRTENEQKPKRRFQRAFEGRFLTFIDLQIKPVNPQLAENSVFQYPYR